MFEMTGSAFFEALGDAAARHLEPGHPCLEAIRAAVRANDSAATLAVQEALAALDPAITNALMAQAHKILRESPAGILGAWNPGAGRH